MPGHITDLSADEPRVAIIGAGASGLCMAAKLLRAGIRNFVVCEKAASLGGTWRDNTYPGLTCDLPSHLYQFSFAMNPAWSHRYSPGTEIRAYLNQVADSLDLRRFISFDTEVTRARHEGGRWHITTSRGTIEADFLVSATGILHRPRVPDIPGLGSFAGPAFHSSRWDESLRTTGRRVAVIGNGSSGAQITAALAGTAERLLLFQRTAQWILPAFNHRYSRLSRYLRAKLPLLNRISYRAWFLLMNASLGQAFVKPGWQRRMVGWVCRKHLGTVRDPDLRAKLTPPYQPLCKRIVFSRGFYRAVQRSDVDLITEPIDHIEPRGLVTSDGRLHEADVLVLATGFDARAYLRPIEVIGPDGGTLEDLWRDGARAWRTIAIPGFPNLFMLQGPHSPFGNNSFIAVAESQADYISRWIRRYREAGGRPAAPSKKAYEQYNAELREVLPHTIWASGCASWYVGPDGLPEVWPWSSKAHTRMLAPLRADEFEAIECARTQPHPSES